MIVRLEQTVELVRQNLERFGSGLQPPAGDAEIDDLQRQCRTRYRLSVPRRYIHLLQITDGIEDNGARFYGSKRRSFTNIPDRSLPEILGETAKWWHVRKQLLLGNIEDQLFWYDHNADEYHVWDVSGTEPHRRFKEFDEIFAYAFDEGRLYVPDLPPPPKWDSF